ncbi:MmgE/PrpD family protein [Jannaschia ovalis]|uniref:MmgE/PrpD family protein n=1 Tax=Jannaschia ovalis TaxID=3038773 RepID=A0ABY8LAE0_9RHOB|nr:MmgE/PrpD family protein [Jannaschia sp. GRR-S6-38]WGH77582.1 MmgE/PrpD family protein [Jannaschia sp. GRR-S6-38]
MDPIAFARDTTPLPAAALHQARRCLLDLGGVGWGGAGLPMARIARDHAAGDLPGAVPLAFDTRMASPMGAALAAGMTIDALDGHDGFNPAKGHCGCGLLAGLIAVAPDDLPGAALLDLLARGYELASRLAIVQHASCPDYHTSGSWVAPALALLAGRIAGLDRDAMAHAAGIAEYHGPRSQMMRCIDHPTMVKDGSGQGAMVGVQAALLAARGFTGAPARTLTGAAWADLGRRWMIAEQYFKPYPVCRWAQPPVEAVLSLRADLRGPVTEIVIETFHESTRLATCHPATPEEAQYSTAFPVAIALARGGIGPADLHGAALHDPEVRRLAACLRFEESAEANALFPGTRIARARITAGGRNHVSDWHRPRWDAEAPPSDAELRAKFDAFTDGILPPARQRAVAATLWDPADARAVRDALRPALSASDRGDHSPSPSSTASSSA